MGGHGAVPQAIEGGDRPAAKWGAFASADVCEDVVAPPHSFSDGGAVRVKGEALVEGGAEVDEGIHFREGVCGGGREVVEDSPWDVGAAAALRGGLEEGHDM